MFSGETMKSKSAADRDYELWVLLSQVQEVIFKARENELRAVGVTPRKAAVLFIIKAIDGLATPAEIARWMYREHHSVVGILNRMEKEGLLKMKKGIPRKHMISVELTKKGEEAYIRSRDLVSIHNIMSSLSKVEKDNFRKHLETLRDRALMELKNSKQTTVFPYP
jgi:DNA-binding MarR family transcriptional regulator